MATKWGLREKKIMARYGIDRVPLSGAGWIAKEDGASDDGDFGGLLTQLKSTDGKQITVKLADLHAVIKNARIGHKTPLFMLDFLSGDEQYILMRPADLADIARQKGDDWS